jgi:transcriptional regulator with XRE-family HTH domain
MTKKSFGDIVKTARVELGLSQRGLAAVVSVKGSHIAYIERGMRRPSLPLLRRLADTLQLNRRELLYTAYPEAKYLVGNHTESAPAKRPDAWQRFASNRPLLRRHNITRAELRVLKQVSLLERVACPRNFLFILNAIRQSAAAQND